MKTISQETGGGVKRVISGVGADFGERSRKSPHKHCAISKRWECVLSSAGVTFRAAEMGSAIAEMNLSTVEMVSAALELTSNASEFCLNAFERGLNAFERRLNAFESRLKAFKRRLKAFKRSLRAFERSLRAFTRRLNAFERSLNAGEMISAIAIVREGQVVPTRREPPYALRQAVLTIVTSA